MEFADGGLEDGEEVADHLLAFHDAGVLGALLEALDLGDDVGVGGELGSAGGAFATVGLEIGFVLGGAVGEETGEFALARIEGMSGNVCHFQLLHGRVGARLLRRSLPAADRKKADPDLTGSGVWSLPRRGAKGAKFKGGKHGIHGREGSGLSGEGGLAGGPLPTP
jgi:hypothetical protein